MLVNLHIASLVKYHKLERISQCSD